MLNVLILEQPPIGSTRIGKSLAGARTLAVEHCADAYTALGYLKRQRFDLVVVHSVERADILIRLMDVLSDEIVPIPVICGDELEMSDEDCGFDHSQPVARYSSLVEKQIHHIVDRNRGTTPPPFEPSAEIGAATATAERQRMMMVQFQRDLALEALDFMANWHSTGLADDGVHRSRDNVRSSGAISWMLLDNSFRTIGINGPIWDSRHLSIDALSGVKWHKVLTLDDKLSAAGLSTSLAAGGQVSFGASLRGIPPMATGHFTVTGGRIPHSPIDAAEYLLLVCDDTGRRSAEQRLVGLAEIDPLTGIGNRRYFDRALSQAFQPAEAVTRQSALVLIDLDGFKPINDTFGHPTGDQILRIVAQRLSRVTRASDRLARIGGDEFAIVLRHALGAQDGPRFARRILKALHRPIQIEGSVVDPNCSVGVAVFAAEEDSATAVMARADRALYQAKANGGAQYVCAGIEVCNKPLEQIPVRRDPACNPSPHARVG